MTSEKEKRQKQGWAERNREKCRASSARHRQNHLTEIRERQRLWAAAHPQRRNSVVRRRYKREWESVRRAKDPVLCLLQNNRLRIRLALRGAKVQKSLRTPELIGCTGLELRVYLEARFRPGMTWENYGSVWHVDHRRPCASFDLTDPRNQKVCFHFTNLQPLFAGENLKKGAKYVHQ